MARIRSVHPGLFTDDAFMQAAPLARLLLIGLWTEADDQGVFDWKPATLKARILPFDTVDVPALLAELEALNIIRGYEHGGRKLGAVRNFRRYQRPKKPNATYFLPSELRTYVALDGESSEPTGDNPPPSPQKAEPPSVDPPPVRNQFPTGGEKSPQMEDGGRRKEEERDSASLRSASARRAKSDVDEIEARCREAANLVDDAAPALLNISPILALLDRGWTLEIDILPVLRSTAARGKRGKSWDYYVRIVEDSHARNQQVAAKPPPPVTTSPDDAARNKLRRWLNSGFWMPDWDGKPGEQDCTIPAHILAEFGYPPGPESRV